MIILSAAQRVEQCHAVPDYSRSILSLHPHKHAFVCQYWACTGPMLAVLAQYSPVLAHYGMFTGLFPGIYLRLLP